MSTSKAYDDLVEGFRAKISGNVSSVKMTEAETQEEISKVTENAFAGLREKNKAKVAEGLIYKCDICGEIYPRGSGHIHELKKRRGRPKGSRNKPKAS